MSAREQRYCVVRGRVRGVGFRAFVREVAGTLGLRGWVRNLEDGSSVAVLAEGHSDHLDKLVSRLNDGPPLARVDDIDCRRVTVSGIPAGFEIRR